MFKKIISILILLFIIACGSHKQVVYISKPKPIVKKIVVISKKIEPIIVDLKPAVTTTTSNDSQVLEATSKVKVTNEMVLNYISNYKEIAKNNMQQFGVPASITLSQALLESGSGTGSLCLQANNHFGIKCRKDWTGPIVKYDDDALQECFRKYADSKDSFKDHSQFLLSKPWYAKLFELDKKDYKAWAKGLKSAGYATDPQYPQKLITLIEKYKLYEIDDEVILDSRSIMGVDEQIAAKKLEVIAGDTNQFYAVSPKDTLYSISKKFNLSVDDIKKLNNMTDNALTIGQTLKIR